MCVFMGDCVCGCECVLVSGPVFVSVGDFVSVCVRARVCVCICVREERAQYKINYFVCFLALKCTTRVYFSCTSFHV